MNEGLDLGDGQPEVDACGRLKIGNGFVESFLQHLFGDAVPLA